MERIAIVGAGQAGLQLALGLLGAGFQVTLFSDRSAQDIQEGYVLSSQCMFDSALEIERSLKLNYWEEECPRVEGIAFAAPDGVGGKSLDWVARLDDYAQSVDQRLKIPRWMREFQNRGGVLKVQTVTGEDLEACARSHDLVVVASGKWALGGIFPRDPARSPFSEPQRALALTYVRNLRPRPHPAICFNLIPNVGEYFVFPALTTSGPCEIMVFEGIPHGPMDCWEGVKSPADHLARSRRILENFLPWEAERCAAAELTDDRGVLTGRITPAVRDPVCVLPSGRPLLGMADAVVLNDPITGQGSNNAARCAEIYQQSILDRRDKPADAEWMRQVFERYWTGYAQWVVNWTNLLLKPPAHLLKLLDCAGRIKTVGAAVVNGFDDPRNLFPWFMDAGEAERFIRQEAKAVAERLDRRDFRHALGQFATGVTVVTARTADGRRVGVTVNSFTSVSLDPPLVLWSLSRQAPSLADFTHAAYFGVNVLAANQHHLSRQFSTPLPDKFSGVEFTEGPAGVPLLSGVNAHFVCRNVRQYDGGDHVIFLGEVEDYKYNDGEPLVFHSGRYRLATRHPDIPE